MCQLFSVSHILIWRGLVFVGNSRSLQGGSPDLQMDLLWYRYTYNVNSRSNNQQELEVDCILSKLIIYVQTLLLSTAPCVEHPLNVCPCRKKTLPLLVFLIFLFSSYD